MKKHKRGIDAHTFTYNPALEKLRQEDHEFQSRLD
jgi:hypothetical protein